MKILHKSKRATPPHPQVVEVIEKLANTSNDDLAEVLSEVDSWKWPRSDLNAWIKVLNKFDVVLEEAIRDYDVDKIQVNIFTPATKKVVCEILRFERLLLDNSTNRKMFSSYDRLNSLLFTSDLDILILALNLLLRPSQQYSAQPAVSHALNISTPRLQSLCKRWPSLQESGISLLDLASSNTASHVGAIPTDVREVNFTYYRTDKKEKEHTVESDPFGVTQTPRKASSTPGTNPGAANIHIDEEILSKKEPMDVLADIVEVHALSDDDKFELLCRIRSAMALAPGKEDMREKLIIVRLLAIAIFGHTHSESQATSSLFLHEPDLMTHIAELLQLDHGISVPVQTAAIAALDALGRYRNKVQEVLTAVNAGVNHGILMALFRKTVADVANPECQLPHSFVDALLSFVTYLASHAAGGNMVVGAGLVPLLVQVIENRLTQRLAMVSKIMQLVDNVLYGFTNAFQLFCNGRGVETLVGRIQHEIDFDLNMYGSESRSREVFGSYGELPVARAAVLKHTLRSMHRMMQSSGTAEGLRGLIDSSILQSIKKIIQYRGLFGPSILPMAMNIMATFVHNEPTSLPTIQEAGLPEMFYQAIEAGLEPVIEVIQAIPNAVGALCLNQVGQDQLSARPSIIPGILSIFTSERHLKVLQEKENAVLIGTGIDELIRHHPSLKAPVFDAIKSTLGKIEELGQSFVVPEELEQWYGLLVSSNADDKDVAMEGVVDDSAQASSDLLEKDVTAETTDDEPPTRAHDNILVSYIDVVCRFLEGLFQHVPHCKDFIRNEDGLDRLGRLTALPCLPYDFANSVASDSLVQVMRTMAEVGPNEALFYLMTLVGSSLAETQTFWQSLDSQSKLLQYMDLTGSYCEGNQHFRSLITLHVRITIMADIFSTAGYAHGRAAISLLQTLMTEPPKIIADLGALHRACIWENILLKAGLTSKGIDLSTSSQPPSLRRSSSQISLLSLDSSAPPVSTGTSAVLSIKHQSTLERNAKALKHLTHGLPSALAPFFQAVVKLFYARRNPDPTQKKQILTSSAVIAEIMLGHLKQEVSGDQVHCFAYHSIMLGLITILLVDERTTQNTLHTVLLLAFHRIGGLEAILSLCEKFTTSINLVTSLPPEDRTETAKQELIHAHGGLKVALHLLHPLVSSKPLFESGQTLLVMSRDKKDDDPDYFEPHNFLVRLRLAITPLLHNIWDAFWLVSAPLPLLKSVIQTVLELTGGENEESKAEPVDDLGLASSSLGGGGAANIRATGPDENRIRQLTDMGFPRSAAERALIRSHNNVNAATELLISHPLPFPPDPVPEPSASADIPEDAPPTEAETPSQDISLPPGISSVTETTPEIVASAEQGKTSEEWLKLLNIAREPLKSNLVRQTLRFVDEHPSLIFDVHHAFLRSSEGHTEEALCSLIDDIIAFSPAAYDLQEQPLAVRCRLLALVLSETRFVSATIGSKLMDSLLALLLSNPSNGEAEQLSIPKWLAPHLLVIESLFTIADQPPVATIPKEDEPIVAPAMECGTSYHDARPIVFEFCLKLFANPNLPRDELLSALRLLVLLTRDYDVARELMKRNGVALIFERLKTSFVAASLSYVAIILRHVAEDKSALRGIVLQEVNKLFSQPRTRVLDVASYMRSCGTMALRDPHVFLQVTQSVCQLQEPFSTVHHIMLKSDTSQNKPSSVETEVHKDHSNNMEIDATLAENIPGPPEPLESLVHYLIGELIKSIKLPAESTPEVSQGMKVQASGVSAGEDSTQTSSKENHVSDDSSNQDPRSFSCFLMQCLTELLFSYDACKTAFLSYVPKKRPQTPAKDGNKPKTAALHFLLSELVSFGTINAQPDSVARARITLCSWAMSVIVALCVDCSHGSDSKEVSPELVSVRKFVLEAVSRAIKDLSPAENPDARYGRLLALADLCNRLLTVRFNNGNRRPQDENSTHIAKIMLEKNFVSTLTTALAEVDLNYPNVRGLVASILRPLENLTRVAIKMSRASDKIKDSGGTKAESIVTLSEEDEEEGTEGTDPDREETPDLYRNSSLGMYDIEMEDVHYSPEDDMDADEEDEDADVEMDFGEETGSDATSNSDEEEEQDIDDDASHDDDDEEGWQDEDEEYEEDDLVENDGDDGDGDQEAEDDVDEEMMWQDIQDEDHDPDDVAIEPDEEEEPGEPISIIHANQEGEPDISSDDDGFPDELGIVDIRDAPPPDGEDVFDFADAFNDGAENGLRHVQNPFVVSRRHRGDDMQVFGRSRNVPAAPPEVTVHPLLLDVSSNATRPTVGQSRSIRRPHRPGVGNAHNDLVQTIEDIIGEGAVHLFQHIVTRGSGGGAPETIRLDVPSGALLNLDRGFVHRRPGVLSASVRVERSGRQTDTPPAGHAFDPLLTMQRWTEEAKILNGKFVSERGSTLANHVTLALLPAAIEASKLREEQRQAAKAKAEEDAAAKEREAQSTAKEEEGQAEEGGQGEEEGDQESDMVHEDQLSSDVQDDGDIQMADASDSTEIRPEPSADNSNHAASVEGQPSGSSVPAENPSNSSETAERVTIMIHGNSVDITDMGIDPTFLEALPDDIREEVINQHVRDQRAARIERPPDSQISPEFLNALPPEIRAELIQQERIEQARRGPETAPSADQPPPSVPGDIDPASFIASLDPQLRQVVLLDSDEGFIQTLPSYMVAEAGAYREEAAVPRRGLATRGAVRTFTHQRPEPPRKPPSPRDAIQLLDKSGVATLVRLLFFPQVSKKNLLFKVLVNICENAKTRAELFNLLLSILQSGPGDLSAVDKSFAQMTTRTPKPQSQHTPKSTGKSKSGSDYVIPLALPNIPNETVPDLVAQRCLEALTYIVSANELSSLFFLTEHELPVGLRKMSSKKGKGKEKQVPQTHYPIVLLLSLLDRHSLLKTPSNMESIVALLSTVTKPLTSLKDNKKETVNSAVLSATPATDLADVSEPSVPVAAVTGEAQQVAPSAQTLAPVSSAPAESLEDRVILGNPPQIPHSVLRLIVNILTIGECSGRTFQQSLMLIQNLSHISDARDVIAQELKVKAQEFGQNIYIDLNELAMALQDSGYEVLASSVASRFSLPSSDQAKLLRVLKTIDYMYSPRSTAADDSRQNQDAEKVQSIYESFRFTPLWRRLGDCLATIEEKPDTEHIATVLLPLIEALMVVCKYVGSKQGSTISTRARASASPRSPTTPKEAMEDLFVNFTDTHRKVLNLMVRNNPSLMSGSFSLLVHNARVLDFDNKRNYFGQQLHRRPHPREHHVTLQLNVRRARVFEDSFQYLQRKTGDQIKYGKLSVRFYDEEGVDAGGVTREWFQILARQMFDPNNALFQPCAADRLTYQPNKNSWVNPEHLSFFKFVGRVIGKAIYDGRLLDAYFAKSLYRQILGKQVDYKDVEWVDPEYYNSLCWILENDPTPLDLTFSVEADEFGRSRIFPLKEGGESIPVTQENKREFVQLSANFRLYSSISEQIENLLAGFYEIIPKDLITIFNEQELELLISGTPDIDVDEWRAATEYNGYTSSDPVIVWWWRALKSFNREERAKVLSFATGTSRVPLGGFVDLQGVQGVQRFSIHRAYGDSDRLPQAHTCFNQIDLPQYSSYEMLRQQLLLAINEGGEGFGFA
ncbi:hypothetical protein SERLA73DRAFT_88605 [Serpula lacrymans var. lacrymans S7.3]|uniref:HECT-type E3 ubiquitin transferase n=1 Tax=Serpula lacrymans var. lacrymans (strain S7.3) TaxID=936435 RepID=F8PW13_SERL3|nr:hypothetical protein SERLA73DRAFT_88605 [Serpula lacrymans var. lacrymans S7.3]